MNRQEFAGLLKGLIDACDAPSAEITEVLLQAARHVARNPFLAQLPPPSQHGYQLPIQLDPGPPPPGAPPDFQCQHAAGPPRLGI